MPTEPSPITLFDVVKRAVDVCDPDGTDSRLGDLLAQLEDARRRDELHADADHILRLAARAEWKGDPPYGVVDWLADRGVEV